MERSKYGKETTFLWKGYEPLSRIFLIPTASHLQISNELEQKISATWEENLKKNPHGFDAPKWRTEFVHRHERGAALVYVSPTLYSQHNVMRHEKDQPIGFYPNPITINTVQETEDGYILAGLKGKTSDQKGILGLVGAGFIERKSPVPNPNLVGFTVQKECLEETTYGSLRKDPFDMDDARAMAIVFGSNHDSTISVYLPLSAGKKDVGVVQGEHDELILLSSTSSAISDVLDEGGYKGIPAADHMLGSLEVYLANKRAKRITRRGFN